ncbi:hypothetical protein K432DRAFT_308977 [Lepidopterella palustris CBS 459.81]|uniref:Uncharacterized protein n=1 Tax=Lepidopterella palustris CBS 459.81 TaxID=1314670 RepID=A0A8E2JAX2_9PEZI|nr:hypothetical protein K432DRAFT_308977 [Lepidopterella palustris CBS 459.81]
MNSSRWVQLTTTSDGVDGGSDCFLFHVPDVPIGWQYRDIWRTELKNQPFEFCKRVYVTFFSFALDDLPQNTHVPEGFSNLGTMWGDVFVTKLALEECREDGWAMRIYPRSFLDCLP